MAKKEENPFGEGFDLSAQEKYSDSPYQKWAAVGDKVQGVLVATFETPNQMKGGAITKKYIIEKEDKTAVIVDSRGDSFDRDMNPVLLGQKVGLDYSQDIKTAKGNAFKKVRVWPGPVVWDEPKEHAVNLEQTVLPTLEAEEDPKVGAAPFED